MVELHLTIKCSNASTAAVTAEASDTVLVLKQKVEQVLSVPAAQQRLIYKGRVLKDDVQLETYGVEDGHTVHMVKGAAAASASTASPAPVQPAAPTTLPSPFPNPFGAMGVPGNDVNRLQEQLMRSPDMMQQVMSSPMMDNLLNNPELLRNMMLNNPQTQALLDANPQVRHILNDPQVLRQTMEMMRNPAAMREAMRGQDLAMSQIENLPGGFNALRRVFEDVHEPLMEAQQQQPQAQQPSTTNNPISSTGGALPNPWGANTTNNNNMNNMNMFGAMPPFGGAAGVPPAGGMGMGFGDPAGMAAMMSNPAMQEMMTRMLSDPAMLDAMASSNPQLSAMLQNPQMRAMMQNPAFVRQMLDPNVMNMAMQMQAMGGMPFPANNNGGASPFGLFGAAPPAGPSGMNFDSLFANNRTATAAAVLPAERYASQLRQLADMGFSDENANLRALQATQGNVNAAVERLLGGN